MNRYWFVSYHYINRNGDCGFCNTYVRLGDGPFSRKSVSEILMSEYRSFMSIVVLNYFEVDEATFNENA